MLNRSKWSITISLLLFVLFNYLIFSSNNISVFLHIVVIILLLPYILLAGLYLFTYSKEIDSFKDFFDLSQFEDDELELDLVSFILAFVGIGLLLGFIFLPIIALNFLSLALSVPITIILSRLVIKKHLLRIRIFIFLIPFIALLFFFSTFFLSDFKYSEKNSKIEFVNKKKSQDNLPIIKNQLADTIK